MHFFAIMFPGSTRLLRYIATTEQCIAIQIAPLQLSFTKLSKMV